MHPWLRLWERRLELKPAELISWKQRWQEPDYGVSLQPARPARALPSWADQRLMQSSCLFPSIPRLPHMHVARMHLRCQQTQSSQIPSRHLTRRAEHSQALLWSINFILTVCYYPPTSARTERDDYDTVWYVSLPDHVVLCKSSQNLKILLNWRYKLKSRDQMWYIKTLT